MTEPWWSESPVVENNVQWENSFQENRLWVREWCSVGKWVGWCPHCPLLFLPCVPSCSSLLTAGGTARQPQLWMPTQAAKVSLTYENPQYFPKASWQWRLLLLMQLRGRREELTWHSLRTHPPTPSPTIHYGTRWPSVVSKCFWGRKKPLPSSKAVARAGLGLGGENRACC